MSRSRQPGAVRRLLAAPALVALLVAMTACDDSGALGSGDQTAARSLIPSAEYAASHPDTDLSGQLASLQRVIDQLRSSTGSGWVGRQDDVTGYLGELSGGRYAATPGSDAAATVDSFLETYATDLLGVAADQVVVDPEGETDLSGSTVLRATQELDGVPVLDAGLVLSVGGVAEQPRLNSLRGRVFPGLEVATVPRVTPQLAERVVRKLTRGTIVDEPRLVVLAQGSGKLAWEVGVFAAGQNDSDIQLSDGNYYIDAVSGTLLEVRPTTAELAAPSVAGMLSNSNSRVSRRLSKMLLAELRGPQGQPVDVTGTNPVLGQVTAKGLLTGNGVALIDTTTPSYNASSGRGGIYTLTADDSTDQGDLPGHQFVQQGQNTLITDPDAIGAQKISRVVYDYYASIGRNSWDGKGASVESTVNFGDGNFCNAFFSSDLQGMVYGNPCEGPNGKMQLVSLDVTGHEITHGVTDSTAGLNYTGQSGALNEAFSDYFGNVIGDRFYQRDSTTLGEDACKAVTGPQRLCDDNETGTLATRYMLNHNTMDDYLNVIDPGFRFLVTVGRITDNGGVHLNSAIWNNALWSIRTQLAKIDNKPGYQSPLAHDFDLIVYYTLSHQLGPNSTMVDAASAVEDTAVKAGADAAIIRVAKETFDQNKLCAGCYSPGNLAGDIVSNQPQREVYPIVSGKNLAWLEPAGGPGTPVVSSGLSKNPLTFDMAWAGDALITAEATPNGEALVRREKGGKTTKLDDLSFSTFTAGLGGSADGAAWYVAEDDSLNYVSAGGKVTRVRITGLGGDTITSMSAGGGTVGAGTKQGRVLMWKPSTGQVDQIGTMTGGVMTTATYGDHVLAMDGNQSTDVFTSNGGRTHLTDFGFPYGSAMSADYAVFPVAVDALAGGVSEAIGGQMPDTDLWVYSFATNNIYSPLQEKGQQGFPSMSGNRVVWQDGVFGGDDIMSATLPGGL